MTTPDLGPLPEPYMQLPYRDGTEHLFTADQLHAERQRCYEMGLRAAAQAAQPDDSYQDEWFRAKADAVRRIQALLPQKPAGGEKP